MRLDGARRGRSRRVRRPSARRARGPAWRRGWWGCRRKARCRRRATSRSRGSASASGRRRRDMAPAGSGLACRRRERLRSTRSRRSPRSAARARKYSSLGRLVAGDLVVQRRDPGGLGAVAAVDREQGPASSERIVLEHGDLELEDVAPASPSAAAISASSCSIACAIAASSASRSRPGSPLGSRRAISASKRNSGPAAMPGEAARPVSSTGAGISQSSARRPRLVEVALDQRDERVDCRPRRRRPSARKWSSVPFGALVAMTLTMLLASIHGPSGPRAELDRGCETSWRAWSASPTGAHAGRPHGAAAAPNPCDTSADILRSLIHPLIRPATALRPCASRPRATRRRRLRSPR